MYIKYVVLSDSVIKGSDGKNSIIGIFSAIYAQKFPCLHSSLSLSIKVEGSESEIGPHEFQIGFVDADHKPVVNSPLKGIFNLDKQTVPFEGIPTAQELTININSILIPKEGLYEFTVSIDGRYLGSSSLYAVQIRS